MSLKQTLTKIKTEEDVKDAYIKALNLQGYNKTLIDIRTKTFGSKPRLRQPPPL